MAETNGFSFQVHERCPNSSARTATFQTPHGPIATPAFMPVGTHGSVKGVMPYQLKELGASMILANTYHMHLRPGEDTVANLGGLHGFMNWDGPILTDSGGYQVFSLVKRAQITEKGVTFRSHIDGSAVHMSPESATEIQMKLGADVFMAFDHCPTTVLDRDAVAEATERTHRWLARCVERYRQEGGESKGQALFGIVQGGAFEDLRIASAQAIAEHDLIGHAIGGVSIGEAREYMHSAVAWATSQLPEHKPRYLMGVGTPRDFFDAIERGIDLFDCVTPTRHGRTHQAFTSQGIINLRNACWKDDPSPLDPECDIPWLAGFTRGYLRHMCKSNEMLGAQILTIHNLHFFFKLMQRIRAAIPAGTLPQLREEVLTACEQRITK